jgi:hypothetical protein
VKAKRVGLIPLSGGIELGSPYQRIKGTNHMGYAGDVGYAKAPRKLNHISAPDLKQKQE